MTLSLSDIARLMRDIDTCLLCTIGSDGFDARPMSNNRDVEWDGSSWFFALDSTGAVQQLQADPRAMVTYAAEGVWLRLDGEATIHEDRELFARHWDPDIDRWFKEGVDTDGLRLIEVAARSVRYWTYAEGDGEITL